MAKQRVPTDPLAPPPQLQPRATPVDTFHRADTELLPQGPTEMTQVAEALGQFQPALLSVAINAKNRDNLQQSTAAEQKVLADKHLQTRKGLADAVRQGLIPEARNPAFLQAMNEQVARMEADSFDVGLRDAYAQSDSKNNQDISSFVAGFTQKRLEDNGLNDLDPSSKAILNARIGHSVASLQANHQVQWEAQQSQVARDRLYQEVSGNIDSKLVYHGPEALGADIKTRADTLIANGMSGTDANKIIVDAITDKARDNTDLSVLDLLKHVGTGNGVLGNTQYAKDKGYATEVHITNALNEKDSHYWATKERQDKATVGALQAEMASRLAKNRLAPTDDLLGQIAKIDGAAFVTSSAWRTALIQDDVQVHEDPVVKSELLDQLYSGADRTIIHEYAAAHKLGSEGVADAYKTWDIVQEHHNLIEDPAFAKVINEAQDSAGGAEMDPLGNKIARQQAGNVMRDALLQHGQQFPKATKLERLKYLQDFGKLYVGQSSSDVSAQVQLNKAVPPSLQHTIDTGVLPGSKPAQAPTPPPAPSVPQKSLYGSREDLRKSITEYGQAPDEAKANTRLAIQAHALGLDVEQFIRLQSAALPTEAAK